MRFGSDSTRGDLIQEAHPFNCIASLKDLRRVLCAYLEALVIQASHTNTELALIEIYVILNHVFVEVEPLLSLLLLIDLVQFKQVN